IDVIYQKTTGIVRGGGVELRGLKTSPAQVLNNEYNIKLESVKFLSHTNPGLLIPEQFLEVAMQLVFENKCLSSNLRSAIVEVDKDYSLGSFLPSIKTLLRKNSAL
ncbi:unnamed protein product, partial [Timema podura]|nr:unnamed protein product [Timema podura]